MAGLRKTVDKLRTAEKIRAHCKWLLTIARSEEERREYGRMLEKQEAVIKHLKLRLVSLLQRKEVREAYKTS